MWYNGIMNEKQKMTTRDKAVVSAYTGFLMCGMAEMLKYMSEKLGWQLSEEELLARHCDWEFNDELAEKIKPDFLELCGKLPTREKAVISAWTHGLMCSKEELLEYLSEKLGQMMTEQELEKWLAYGELRQKYDAAVLPDFLELCEGDASSKDKASWWR